MKTWIGLLLVIPFAHSLCEETVAGFRRDFRAKAPLVSGWSYLWNSPDEWAPGETPYNMWSGRIGQPSGYLSLREADGIWTADGDRKGNDGTPDRFIALNATGGHPGGGIEVYRNYEGRFAIAAYTVSDSGTYALASSSVSVGESDVGDGIELIVHVNGNDPLFREHVPAGTNRSFDLPLGDLKKDDTVYVGVGPWIKCYADAFQWDFSIVRK